MKTYKVKIRETLQTTVEVQAESLADAEEKVQDGWNQGLYILDAECFTGVEFCAKPQQKTLEPER